MALRGKKVDIAKTRSIKTIMGITEENLNVIAMVEKTSKTHYRYNGERLPATEIYRRNRKRRDHSKYLLSVEIEIENRSSPWIVK